MSIFKWSEQRIQKFKIWDIAVMKTYLASVGIVIGSHFPEFFTKNIWIVAAVIAVTATWLVYKILKE